MHHVAICSHVLVPTRGTRRWLEVAAAIDRDNTPEDRDVILSNDEAVAAYLYHKSEAGNFTSLVQPCDMVVEECIDFGHASDTHKPKGDQS